MFDGSVARLSGKATQFGAFLDSNLDRFGEGLILGGIGVSMWVTGASIIMTDITSYENRGQAVAIRGLSAKVGAILGPLVGALILVRDGQEIGTETPGPITRRLTEAFFHLARSTGTPIPYSN